MKQITNDPEPCRLRNYGGSECGICDCQSPKECPNPPLFTPVGIMMAHITDQFLARVENKHIKH